MFLHQGEKTALIKSGNIVSYNELSKKVQLFSSLYKKIRTSRVGIFSENREGWVYSFYSAWNNHAVVVPIDFMSTIDEVAYLLNDCKPEVVFVSKDKLADFK